MKRKYKEYEKSLIPMPLLAFLADYNKNIPNGFPCVSVAILQKFQSINPGLFRHGDTWSIARHRKKLIDWLSTNHVTA
ncbi:MAG: hypothetical protein HYT98_00805 [Candidatus Sungbacteria bacterium]|nr:hypothetical protein [Candidatus Sungbacteria bacterium]